MKRSIAYLLFFFLITSAGSGFAQDTTKVVDRSLSGQYKEILARSRNMDGYKLIRPERIATFWKNVRDTLTAERNKLKELQGKLSSQDQEIAQLKNTLNTNNKTLEESNSKVDSINLLGISTSKGTYNLLMWGIVLVLVLAVVFLFTQSSKNVTEAKYRIKLFEELSGEYQNYKTKANDKEKKLARELQDERNKLDDLKNGKRF